MASTTNSNSSNTTAAAAEKKNHVCMDNTNTTRLTLSETRPLSTNEKEQLRKSTSLVFQQLQQASKRRQYNNEHTTTKIPSWIQNPFHDHRRTERCHYFDMFGFCIVNQFCSHQEIVELKDEMKRSVQEHWHPSSTTEKDDKTDDKTYDTFGTDATSNTVRGDGFLDSADQISYFAEPESFNPITGRLEKEVYHHDDDHDNELLLSALNKAGHGMHIMENTAFSKYAFSTKVHSLVHELGWQDPVMPQSMYIMKQSNISGTVHSHQDSTFLYTTPKQSCLGLWLALDDATLENGCLWVRPQSHLEPVRRQFLRNPKYYYHKKDNRRKNDGRDGKLPETVELLLTTTDQNQKDSSSSSSSISTLFSSFVPVELQAGDLIVFCGTLDHFSLPNMSNQPRHTFQLHVVEGSKANVEWSNKNWLQYPHGISFSEWYSPECFHKHSS